MASILDIFVGNSTSSPVVPSSFNSSCLRSVIDAAQSALVPPSEVEACSLGTPRSESSDSWIDKQDQIEEGISYIAGNTLWAFYQFTVVIVLLSILRARMVNTYHRVFKEADVQWKFFR